LVFVGRDCQIKCLRGAFRNYITEIKKAKTLLEEIIIDVVAAVIREGDLLLVCQRPIGKRHAGLWEFPGGKLEANEALFDGAKRELLEELGLNVIAVGKILFSILDPGSTFRVNFVEVIISSEKKPFAVEHSQIAWLDIDQLRLLALAPTDQRFVDWLAEQKITPDLQFSDQ